MTLKELVGTSEKDDGAEEVTDVVVVKLEATEQLKTVEAKEAAEVELEMVEVEVI